MKRSDCSGLRSGMNSGPLGVECQAPVGGLIYIRVSLRFIMASHGRSVSHCTIAGGGKRAAAQNGRRLWQALDRPKSEANERHDLDSFGGQVVALGIHQRRPLLEPIAQPGRPGEDAAVPSYWMDLFTPET